VRTYATPEQISRLAWKMFINSIEDAKAYLEPRQYQVDHINYPYKEVQASLNMVVSIQGAIKNGQLKATKSKGLTVA